MILIDNYDSFTYNIVQYLKELNVNPRVFKNDEITVEELKKLDFSSIIISPGPKNPDNAGISLAVIEEFHKTKKILGVCLGHQCIAQFFGAKIIKSSEPVHGKTSKIFFTPDLLFEGLEQGFEATRYHSLIVDNNSLPECLIPLAYAKEGKRKEERRKSNKNSVSSSLFPVPYILMAIKHTSYPTYGVQFHPEAILTEGGKSLLKNFVDLL